MIETTSVIELMNSEITSYEEARAYFDAMKGLGSVPGLESIRRLLAELGNPERELPVIHIAGTNGKGSTAAYIASVLKAGGYHVGRFHSPAVFHELETIRIGEKNISKADFTDGMEEIRKAAVTITQRGDAHPTVFEAETALALWYFHREKCDPVILEVGMGGRLDATNVIDKPLVSVLTSISMDHMAFLGDTLSQIATEKAGVIKNGCPAVSTLQQEEAMRVVTDICKERESALYLADPTLATSLKRNLTKQKFTYKGMKFETTLLGNYEIGNAVTALLTIDVLKTLGYPISDARIQKGILDCKWPGRFEVIGRKPLFILDGAHNEDAARKLLETLNFHFTNKKIITIMGMLKDKECEKVVEILSGVSSHVVTVTPPHNPRALPAYELALLVRPYQPMVTAADSIQEAVELSYLMADKDDVILACGSLSYLKEAREWAQAHDRFGSDTHGRSRED